MRKMTKTAATLCVSAVAAFGFTGAASAQVPPGNQAGDSLVNVQVGDVTVLVPVSVAAALCDVNVNVLAGQLDTGDATCEATAESVATPGNGSGNGGGNQAGNSLVNVQIGDITANDSGRCRRGALRRARERPRAPASARRRPPARPRAPRGRNDATPRGGRAQGRPPAAPL